MYAQLEIEKEGDFYRVNSAFPVRRTDYETRQGMKKLWPESEPRAKATGQPSAFAVGNAEKSSSADPNAATQSGDSVPASTPQSKAQSCPTRYEPEASLVIPPKNEPERSWAIAMWQLMGISAFEHSMDSSAGS